MLTLKTRVHYSVPSLEQNSLAEFGGKLTKPKVYYENGKNNLGPQFTLATKVKKGKNLTFKVNL